MHALFIVRLLALSAWLVCLGGLLVSLAQSWDTFNPSYWAHYLQQRLAGPLIGILLSSVVLLVARPITRWLARD